MVFEGITDPSCLEALACRESLALAEDLNLTKIFVASDCQPVVKEILEGSMGRHGSIIMEIKSRASHFEECCFAYENRASNFEAHNLAKHMISFGAGRQLWLGAPYSVTVSVNILINE